MAKAFGVMEAVWLTVAFLICAPQRSFPWAWAQPLDAGYVPGPQSTLGEIPEGFAQRRDSAHFVMLWRQAETTDAEIETAMALAERLFARLTVELGAAHVPSGKLIVTFEGPGLSSTGQARYAFVDPTGRIHLFRWSAARGGYLGQLGHEMVHAFRMAWRWNRPRRPGYAFDFVEEGFAELMATRLEPDTPRLPWYGFPMPVVVGQWLVHQEAPPLRLLMERHGWLNLRCLLQAYTLRGSFFHYLYATFGKEAVLKLAYSDDEMTAGLFAQVFGQAFDSLEQDWRAQTGRTFAATANTTELARDYRDAVKHFYICQAGKDY